MNNSTSNLSSSQFKSNSVNLNKNSSNDKVVTCPFSGIKIIRPLIEINEFREKMTDKKMVKINNISFSINKKTNDVDGDWVTIGVISDKLPIRKTKKGNDFSIWKLSDLQNLDKSVVLMLFGDAHDKQWKMVKGSVIGLLNCKILPNKDTKSDLTLSIDKGSKLMHLGSSKDLGYCRAPKNNGDMCNTIVNLSQGNYCVYHIKIDYAKISSLRPELQTIMNGFGVQNNFSSGKNLQTLNSVKNNEKNSVKLDETKKKELIEKYQSRKVLEANVLNKQLKMDFSLSARNLSQFQKNITTVEDNEKSFDLAKQMLTVLDQNIMKPKLGKGFKPGDTIDFNKKESSMTIAKRKAIAMMKNRKIEKQNPNDVFSSSKKSSFDLKNILNQVEKNLIENENNLDIFDIKSKTMNADVIERRKRKAEDELQSKKRKLEAIDAIMKIKSSHENELIEKEREVENQYFSMMEKKEQIEDRMSSIFKTDCSVVICKVCKYTDHKQSDFCKDKKHLVIRKNAVKRFFRCITCKVRTHTFDQIYPIKTCKCGSNKFDKCSMYNIKTEVKLSNENLLIRGEEKKIFKFLSSFNYSIQF